MATTVTANTTNPENHVKFSLDKEERKNHHEEVEIVKVKSNEFAINLGYMKVDHYYKLKFELDLTDLIEVSQNTSRVMNLKYLIHKSSRHLSFKEIKKMYVGGEDEKWFGKYSFSLVFHAFKEKVDIEKAYFRLVDSDDDVTTDASEAEIDANDLVISFEAKVLGAHQGTPMLRNGIVLMHNGGDDTQESHFNLN